MTDTVQGPPPRLQHRHGCSCPSCDYGRRADFAESDAVIERGLPRPTPPKRELDEEELDTILTIARNGQSGRITEFEIKALVAAYRKVWS